MLENKDIVALAKATAKANKAAPVAYSFNGKNYSYEQMNETLNVELNDLYKNDKEKCFAVLTEIMTEVVPNKVGSFFDGVAETKQMPQGVKAKFRRKMNNKMRAKQFVTRVGLAGIYEVFKLGGAETFEVETNAIGGAAQIGFEEFLDGRVDFAELIDVIVEGMADLIREETGKALIGGLNQLPAKNKVEYAGFDEVQFDRLLRIADSYGSGKATIYCDASFAAKLMPAKVEMFTDAMKQAAWDKGYLASYKGHVISILPNGVADASNTALANDPGYVWIIPGGAEKPVKIVFEGELQTKEFENRDWSNEIHMYRKVGVGALLTNDTCVYHDTSLNTEI